MGEKICYLKTKITGQWCITPLCKRAVSHLQGPVETINLKMLTGGRWKWEGGCGRVTDLKCPHQYFHLAGPTQPTGRTQEQYFMPILLYLHCLAHFFPLRARKRSLAAWILLSRSSGTPVTASSFFGKEETFVSLSSLLRWPDPPLQNK